MVYLLGLREFLAAATVKRAEKAREDIKKTEPQQERLRAKSLTEQAKASNAKRKIDSLIRTHNLAEAEKENGKAAMIQAAEDEVALRLDERNAKQITLDAANDDLQVQAALLEVWRIYLDDAAVGLQSARADWEGTDTSAAAVALTNTLKVLLATVTAMSAQISSAPLAAGDDMAIHLNQLIVWRTRLDEAAVAYSVARAALPVGTEAPAVALAEAGEVMQQTITGLAVQLHDFDAVAQLAQATRTMFDIASEEYEGALAALDGLMGPTGSTRGAMTEAVARHLALKKQAEIAAAQSGQLNAWQAMRARMAGGG